jgi:tetratricopeptide (TPR) repeat protein
VSIFSVTTCPQYRPCCPILGACLVGCSLLWASGCGSFAAEGMNAEGVRLFSEARYDDAIQEFHKALNNDPRNADGYYNLAATYHRMGTQTGNKQYLQQAEQYYHMCQDHDPDHCQCYRGLAVLLVQQGRSEEAFHLIASWADRQPALAEPKIELARLYQEFGDVQTAKSHLNEAVRVDPHNARALAALGSLHEQLGEQGAALQDYQQSLARDPDQPALAARVAALHGGFVPASPSAASSGGTQLATGGSSLLR